MELTNTIMKTYKETLRNTQKLNVECALSEAYRKEIVMEKEMLLFLIRNKNYYTHEKHYRLNLFGGTHHFPRFSKSEPAQPPVLHKVTFI